MWMAGAGSHRQHIITKNKISWEEKSINKMLQCLSDMFKILNPQWSILFISGRYIVALPTEQHGRIKIHICTTRPKLRHAFCFVCSHRHHHRISIIEPSRRLSAPNKHQTSGTTFSSSRFSSQQRTPPFPPSSPCRPTCNCCCCCFCCCLLATRYPDTPLFLILLFTSVKITIKCDNKFHASC